MTCQALHVRAALVIIGSLLAVGCDRSPSRTTDKATPTQTPSPETEVEPAFATEVVVEGLQSPVYATFAPGVPDTMYVVERAGRVRIVEDGTLLDESLLDITRRVRTEGEEGLLSIAFHPRFRTNRLFYVYFNDRRGDINLVEYRAGESSPPTLVRELLFVDKPSVVTWHNGGQIVFGPDGHLYTATGDGARNPLDGNPNPPPVVDPKNLAQRLESPFGKLYRIDVDAEEPAEMIGYGLRNPWRFSFDRPTGEWFVTDVGQFNWEEVDRVDHDRIGDRILNFGWSAYEGREQFEPDRLNPTGALIKPFLVYGHEGPGYCIGDSTIVGGYVYRGEAIPELRGRYVFGDFCSGRIFSTSISGRRGRARVESANVYQLVAFALDPDGEILIVSLSDGTVSRLVRPASADSS